MKQTWLVGALASMLFVASAAAQSPTGTQSSSMQQPAGNTNLGSVTIPRAVMADGKPLPAGRYTLRLTTETAAPGSAPGALPELERWVEFVQGSQVRGRELASVVPAEEVKMTMPGPDMPGRVGRTGARVEMLKGGEYLRVWVARGGTNYLVHLSTGNATK